MPQAQQSNYVQAPSHLPRIQQSNYGSKPHSQLSTYGSSHLVPQLPQVAHSQQSSYGLVPQVQQVQQQGFGSQTQPFPISNQVVDLCPMGHTEHIQDSNQSIETYCRCPNGSYGNTCKEDISNPCSYGGQTYYPADAVFGDRYYVQCNWDIPYVFKCPANLVWNQELLTCDWPMNE